MRSCNIYFWESSIKDDSANNRIIKVKLTKAIRNANKELWEKELRWLQNHTIRGVLYPTIMWLYADKDNTFKKLVAYKKLISSKFENERLWDLECYGMLLYVDCFKLWTKDEFIDMIEYNVEADVSNVRDTTWADPINTIESLVYGLIYRAEQEKSLISYWRFDQFSDNKYNHYWQNNFTSVIKIDLSTIKTAITNYDNDVEKINEIMPGFVKTVGQSIFICSYWDEIINRIKILVDEWFVELDIEAVIKVNLLIKGIVNLMCNGKNFQTWYSVEKANASTFCPEMFWNGIKKVIFSLWIML